MEEPLSKAKTRQADSVVSSTIESSRLEEEEIEQQSSWLWFEFTPYEIGCDELGGMFSGVCCSFTNSQLC